MMLISNEHMQKYNLDDVIEFQNFGFASVYTPSVINAQCSHTYDGKPIEPLNLIN